MAPIKEPDQDPDDQRERDPRRGKKKNGIGNTSKQIMKKLPYDPPPPSLPVDDVKTSRIRGFVHQ